MLASLHIENVAVIRSIDVDFSAGFSVLTGETGAGKSIIIDSMACLFGEKMERDLIRTGETSAWVSGLFTDLSPAAVAKIAEHGVYPDEEGNILVQRNISLDGKSQSKINGRTVTLSIIRAIMPSLLSIHGQNDTRALADSDTQRNLLDVYASNQELKRAYKPLYEAFSAVCTEIEELSKSTAEKEQKLEMLTYQLREIDAAKLRPGEEEQLVDKKVKLKSREKILKNTEFAYKALRGSEKGSAAYLIDKSAMALSQLSEVLPECAEYAEKLRDVLDAVSDVGEEAYAIFEETEDGEHLDINDIEARLDLISKLKRKYGLTLNAVLAYREKIASEIEMLSSSDLRLSSLRKEAEIKYASALEVARKIHARRVEYGEKLRQEIKETLGYLDMPKVEFTVDIRVKENGDKAILSPSGVDTVEFFISANAGLDPMPIGKIASGGELARIMLAVKCALSAADDIGTVIFDEIDAGVSGKTARKIGFKMRELSAVSQVLSVTHSAQIASLGDTHFRIDKRDVCGKTETRVQTLDREGRIAEISRILGGLQVTDAQRAAAIDMIDER